MLFSVDHNSSSIKYPFLQILWIASLCSRTTPRNQSAMSHKPTLVFVPGAWHKASIWSKVASILQTQQYKCVCVDLPSTASNPSATFLDDVTAVRNSIIAETTQGRDVVVVVHSYGGQVGNSAIKGLAKPREAGTSSVTGQTGHVIGLTMIASGFTPTGVAFLEGFGGRRRACLWWLDGYTDMVFGDYGGQGIPD